MFGWLIGSRFFYFYRRLFFRPKKAAQEFVYRADQESLADQIYSSMCILYDAKDDDEQESSDEEHNVENEQLAESAESSQETIAEVAIESTAPQTKYRAILSGFPASLHEDAKKMVTRLTHKGYPAEIIEHTSIHKKITKKWYQVVTKLYVSKDALEKIKPQLAKIGYVKEQSIKIEEYA